MNLDVAAADAGPFFFPGGATMHFTPDGSGGFPGRFSHG
jgi:hypothetical protein